MRQYPGSALLRGFVGAIVHVRGVASDRTGMEISAPPRPAGEPYSRMHRLSAAIDDPDSSYGQRREWTAEYVELAGSLVGSVGARAANGAVLLDLATRPHDRPDGHAPRPGPDSRDGTDLYL